MICCTTTASAVVKGAVPRDKQSSIEVTKFINVCNKMSLARNTNDVDAFVLTSDDLRPRGALETFLDALYNKHVDSRVIFIKKKMKDCGVNSLTPGIDVFLESPRGKDLQDVLYKIAVEATEKPIIQSSSDQVYPEQQKSSKRDWRETISEDIPEEIMEEQEFEEEIPKEERIILKEENEEEPSVKYVEPDLATRMKKAQSIAEIQQISREFNATSVFRDLAKENNDFKTLEEMIRVMKNRIIFIQNDPSITDPAEKATKIKNILFEKANPELTASSMIEKYLRDIILTIVDSTQSILDERLKELEKMIRRSATLNPNSTNFGLIAGLNEERTNTTVELATLRAEIENIATSTTDTVHEIAIKLGENCSNIEDSEDSGLQAALTLSGIPLVSSGVLEVMRRIFKTAPDTLEEFSKAQHDIESMMNLINQLHLLSSEQIARQEAVIKMLQSNKVENTVIAKTLLKKSMRVFVGIKGCGCTIVPTILSKYKSKENSTVICIDISEESKFSDYGITPIPLLEYYNIREEKDLCFVEGSVSTPEQIQRFNSMLLRAADFYKVINIIASPNQLKVLESIAHDVLCINYVTDTKRANLDRTRSIIESTKLDNVGRRLIVNQCDMPISNVIGYMKLTEVRDIQIIKVPYVHQIQMCAMSKYDPSELSQVKVAFTELRRYA